MARIRSELKRPVYREKEIEAELARAIEKALRERVPLVEIILDPDSDGSRKRVLRFLSRPEIKKLFYRIEKGEKNSGRILVRFRHENISAFHG